MGKKSTVEDHVLGPEDIACRMLPLTSWKKTCLSPSNEIHAAREVLLRTPCWVRGVPLLEPAEVGVGPAEDVDVALVACELLAFLLKPTPRPTPRQMATIVPRITNSQNIRFRKKDDAGAAAEA